MKNKKNEETVQLKVCNWIKKEYPSIKFDCSMAGLRLTIPQASKASKMRSCSNIFDGIYAVCKKPDSFPDLTIYRPIIEKETLKLYCGFFLELKGEGVSITKKNGLLLKNEHLEDQLRTILKLREEGYYADFGLGFDDSINKINAYLKCCPLKMKDY